MTEDRSQAGGDKAAGDRKDETVPSATNDSKAGNSQGHLSVMSDFKDLDVWKKAHTLALSVHRTASRVRTASFASLHSQMIRAAMSIDANIAEGRGSLSPLESHVIMAGDLGMIAAADYAKLIKRTEEVRKMLFGLIRYLEKRLD